MRLILQMDIIGQYSTRFTDINKAFLNFIWQHNLNQSLTGRLLNNEIDKQLLNNVKQWYGVC